MSVAKTYAKAFQKVGPESKEGLDGLRRFTATYVSDLRIQKALQSPNVGATEKQGIIKALAKSLELSPLAVQFLMLLQKHNQLSKLSDVTNEVDRVLIESAGGLLGEVYSAEALSDADLADIKKTFQAKLGKKIELRQKLDAGLIAGLKVVLGGITYDGSMKTRIRQYRESVLARVGSA